MKQENPQFYYGLESISHALRLAEQVCAVLGHGHHQVAINMLLETAAAETHLGQYQDPTPNGAGHGLTQIDAIALKDVQARTRARHKQKIQNAFGLCLDELTLADLQSNPLAALVVTRCFYLLIADPIPPYLHQRAHYWKRHYNTAAGKGTAAGYQQKTEQYFYGQVLL